VSKIIITSTQWPYYGGAATNALALIKYLRNHGHDVAGIFFESQRVNVDPDKIGGIWRFDPSEGNPNIIRKVVMRHLGGRPDVIMGKNYAAPIHSKSIFPNVKIIYLVTGSPQMTELSKNKISSIRHLSSRRGIIHQAEYNCIKASDLVIPNSPQARSMLIKNYGSLGKIHKPIDTSLAFNRRIKNVIPFKDRKYDVAFICSNFNRSVKNSALAKKILRNKSFYNSRKIVIGGNSNSFSGLRNITIKSLIPQNEVIKIIQNSKVVICTSYYDASPNVIKEAIMSGSNILVSKNCGWYEQYPSEFVCSDIYNESEWIAKLMHLKVKKIEHSIKFGNNKLIKQLNEVF